MKIHKVAMKNHTIELNYSSIKKHLEDAAYLDEKITHYIKTVNNDIPIITKIDIDDNECLFVEYDYHSHGYRYDDVVCIPLSLLNASDEELYEHKKRLIEEARKKAEEDKKIVEQKKIAEEISLLKKLKAKYES